MRSRSFNLRHFNLHSKQLIKQGESSLVALREQLDNQKQQLHFEHEDILQEYMQHWPIPQKQIDLLGPSYPQNDGYN